MTNHNHLFFALAFLSCAPHLVKPTLKPEEIPGFAFKNLKRQRSFAFEYRLEQKEPIAVSQSAAGIYILPDQEEVQGRWTYGDGSSLAFHLVGLGDREYEKTDQGWEANSRGEETDLLVQVERALALGKLNPTSEKPDWEFEFKPNVPFLDPTFSKKIVGRLVVNKNYLPKRIAAWDENRTVFWQVDFKDYNQPERVNLPFVKQMRVLVATGGSREAVERIKQRFLTFGLEAKVSLQGSTVELTLAENIKEEQLQRLLARGEFQIARVRWLEFQPAAETTGTTFDGRPVAVESPELSNLDLSGARVSYDPLGRPVVELILNPAGEKKFLEFAKNNISNHYGIIIDGTIWAINYIDKIPTSAIISLVELPTYTDARMIEALINSGVLPQPGRIIEIKKGE